jgi:hypothetical protein
MTSPNPRGLPCLSNVIQNNAKHEDMIGRGASDSVSSLRLDGTRRFASEGGHA